MSRSSEPRGTLYVVGTPIGNLDDLSPRAVHVFAESELVACEDTRRTATILARHGLSTRMISYHKFNEARRLPEILRRLDRGERIALATDGGTPGISDPGALLVHAARRAGHRIIPVPGPSAVTALRTAAAAVLSARKHLKLAGTNALVLAGTGPVGLRAAQLLAAVASAVIVGAIALRPVPRVEPTTVPLALRSNERTILVPIGREALSAVATYCHEERPVLLKGRPSPFLFVTARGKGMTRQGFWKLLRVHGNTVG